MYQVPQEFSDTVKQGMISEFLQESSLVNETSRASLNHKWHCDKGTKKRVSRPRR